MRFTMAAQRTWSFPDWLSSLLLVPAFFLLLYAALVNGIGFFDEANVPAIIQERRALAADARVLPLPRDHFWLRSDSGGHRRKVGRFVEKAG
jgi:hypothetical protein